MLRYQNAHLLPHSLIRLHARQLKNPIRDNWLLIRLSPVLRIRLAIPLHRSLLADIAMRPVRRTLPVIEQASLQVHVLLLRELAGSHADVLDMTNAISLREAGVVHCAGVPGECQYLPENLNGEIFTKGRSHQGRG